MSESQLDERQIILDQSFELVKKLYDELDSSAESINTRAGITLGLIASALTASDFSTWSFSVPFFSPKSSELVENVVGAVSLILFISGTWFITRSLLTKRLTSPYNLSSLQLQRYSGKKEGDENVFKSIKEFQGKQIDNFVASIELNKAVVELKGANFNRGIWLLLCSLALVVMSRIVW